MSAEVLFLPSFHPETMIQATQYSTFTMLRMATMTSSIWYYEQAANVSVPLGSKPDVIPPELCEETLKIDEPDGERFWRAIHALEPMSIPSTGTFGIDGMSIRASYHQADLSNSFTAWGPAPESPQGRFVGELFGLAWKLHTSKLAIERLEQLHGYLRLGLPVRWIESDVKCVRLFGRLSSNDEADLRRLFGQLLDEEELVIDMTNFEGMGTLLHPMFAELASKHPRLAWAASKAARKHLLAIDLEESIIHETVEAACQSLMPS